MRHLVLSLAALSGLVTAAPAFAQTAGDTSWSGPYVGLNLGYGGGDFKYDASGTTDAAGTDPASARLRQSSSGVIGGGQIGYNHELSNGVVLGLETDIAAADIGAKTSLSGVDSLGNSSATEVRSKIDYLGTVRGRVGKAMFDGRFMPYVTGGFAYGGVKSSGYDNATGFSTPTSTQTGWTAGAGAEYALDPPPVDEGRIPLHRPRARQCREWRRLQRRRRHPLQCERLRKSHGQHHARRRQLPVLRRPTDPPPRVSRGRIEGAHSLSGTTSTATFSS